MDTGSRHTCGFGIVECGFNKPKNPQFEITEPMLVPRNPAKGGTSGPGNDLNSIHLLPTWRKVKGGKRRGIIDFSPWIWYTF
jgi:hypothetical protein